ncbi:MAG: DUF4363 family protein [Clostridia bacterium]|nr:DUF4363 family protein [Clostridia bacterium]
MKDVIIATVILVLIISVSATFYSLSMNFCSDMSDGLQQAKEALIEKDYELATQNTEECMQVLEKSNIWLSAMANHEELNAMKTGLLRAQQYIIYLDDKEAMAELGELTGLINHFKKSEQVTVENIF